MFCIAATISLAIMLTITPIIIGKAYSVEYSGQTTNTGNSVSSEWITMELYLYDDVDKNYTKISNYTLNTLVIDNFDPESATNEFEGEGEPITLTPDNLYVKLIENIPLNSDSTSNEYKINSKVEITYSDVVDGIKTISNTSTLSFYEGNEEIENLSPDVYYKMVLTSTFNNKFTFTGGAVMSTITLSTNVENIPKAEYVENRECTLVNINIKTPVGKINNALNGDYIAVKSTNGEIYIQNGTTPSPDGAISTNKGGFDITMSGLSEMKFYIHIKVESLGGSNGNDKSRVDITCMIDRKKDGRIDIEKTFEYEIGKAEIIEKYIGLDGNKLYEVTDLSTGDNCIELGSEDTISIEFGGEQTQKSKVYISFIEVPTQSDDT